MVPSGWVRTRILVPAKFEGARGCIVWNVESVMNAIIGRRLLTVGNWLWPLLYCNDAMTRVSKGGKKIKWLGKG